MNKNTETKKEGFLSRARTVFPGRMFSIRLSISEQMLFAKRLSFLSGAGVSLVESVNILLLQARSRRLRTLLSYVMDDLSNGQYLYVSLARFKRSFSPFAVSMIRVGELSGQLSENLRYLAEELKKKHILRRKMISALVYPIFVTVATLGIAGLLTAYIFPKILPVFTALRVSLPWTTRVLLSTSTFLREHGIVLIFSIIAACIIHGFLRRHVYAVKRAGDWIIISIPFVRNMMLAFTLANFCRTLGLLLKSGITVTESLFILSGTLTNSVYREEGKKLADHVIGGKTMGSYLSLRPYLFPHTMSHLIGVGEKTGNLSNTLMYLSEMYESDLEDMIKNLSSVIEPVLMIFMGLLVGFVAVSVISPIYEITQGLQ